MIRPNHRRWAGGRRAPTGFLWPPPGPSAPPWPHESVYQHGVVFAGTMRANHRRRARGRGGGRVPTDFLWPPSGQSAPPWPHEGACQHGVVFAGPALTPSARAYAYAPSSTPSQAGLPAAEKTPKVISKKGPAHPARPGARTVKVADNMLSCDVYINPESKSRPVNMEVLGYLINLHGKAYVGGNLPAYGETKSLYTITVHIAGRIDLFHLQQLLRVRQGDMPEETINVLDFVLRESPSWKSFFSTTFCHRGDIGVGEGLECWRGPTLMRLSLTIGIFARCFVKAVAVQEFPSITSNLCHTYGRWTRTTSDVKFIPAFSNIRQPVREMTISSSPSSNRMFETSKIQVICRIANFGTFPMQFEGTCTIEQIVSAACRKKNINISDPVIRLNNRNAYLEDKLCYFNTNSDKECSLYVSPRLRGGQPPSSSKCSVPPRIELFVKYVSRLGDELFDVVFLPPDPAIAFVGMDSYFVSLGLKGIEIAKMLFELLESYHERQKCVSYFILANLDYDSTSKKLLFRGGVRTVDFDHNDYCNNMNDAGTVLSEIFRFDEVRLLAGYSGIRIPPGTANNNGKIPKLVQLLIYDLRTGIRQFPGAGISKRSRAYFRCHVGVMTPAARLAFWVTSDLHFEYMGGEQSLDAFIGQFYVADWSTSATRSPAMNTVYCWRTYNNFSLGCQWSCARNFLSHARQNLGALISEKQAEAYLNGVFEWLLYNLLLKYTFRAMVIHWNIRPLPLALPPPLPPYPVPLGPVPRQLKFSNNFTFDELIDTSGSLG